MQDGSMLEQEVADPVNVAHLHVRARQQIALLVTLGDSNRDVSLKAREFIGLGGHYTHYVSLLSLDAELSDCAGEISLLIWCDGGADNKRAQTTKCQE